MRPGGGSQKGSEAERKWARAVSRWWYNGDPNYLWRRPGPGSQFYRQAHRHTGDLIPQSDRTIPYPFPLHVECKNVRDLELSKILTNLGSSFIYKTWAKAVKEARPDLDVILLVKENRRPELVFTLRSTYTKLGWDYSGPELIFPWEDDLVLGIPWAALAGQAIPDSFWKQVNVQPKAG